MSKTKILIGIFFLLLSALSNTASPPVVETVCSSRLTSVFKQEQQDIQNAFNAGKCWYMKYSMQSEVMNPVNGKYVKSHNTGEVFATAIVRILKTEQSDVFMDSLDIFSVSDDNKTITRMKTPRGIFRNSYNMYLQMTQDSLLKQLKVTACQQVNIAGVSYLQFELLPLEPKKNVYAKMTLWASAETFSMKKMYVEMNTEINKNLKNYTLVIEDKKMIKPLLEWQNIRRLFLTDAQKLRAAYASYRYKDLSKNEPN